MTRLRRSFCNGGWCCAARRALGCAMLFAAGEGAAARNRGQEEVSRDFQKSVTLGAGQSVHIEHKFGEVRVHGEPGREGKISATIRAQAGSHDEAQSFADKIQVDVQQTAQGLRIKTVYPEQE